MLTRSLLLDICSKELRIGVHMCAYIEMFIAGLVTVSKKMADKQIVE